jgi:hypothetical protein
LPLAIIRPQRIRFRIDKGRGWGVRFERHHVVFSFVIRDDTYRPSDARVSSMPRTRAPFLRGVETRYAMLVSHLL